MQQQIIEYAGTTGKITTRLDIDGLNALVQQLNIDGWRVVHMMKSNDVADEPRVALLVESA